LPQRVWLHRVVNAEMLSVTATRRLARNRTGRSRRDRRKSGMRRIAPGGRIDKRHAELGGPGHMWTLVLCKRHIAAVEPRLTTGGKLAI